MIAYYIHHHGTGHLARAGCIAAHLTTPVTALSSLAPPADWPGDWLELPRDDDHVDHPTDRDAGGTLHWAPLDHSGLRRRMALLAAWLDVARPLLLIADVSVEVAVWARLMGVPVIVVAMPGHRDDPAHRLGYGLASALLAPWTAIAAPPEWPQEWAAKTHLTGAFSRFDGRWLAPRVSAPRRPRVLVLFGKGGSTVGPADVRAAAAATPEWDWEAVGLAGGRWMTDPWPAICGADVVVTHAGYNAISEVAAARRPAVVIPQSRPHGEQDSAAHSLAKAGVAVVEPAWPPAERWPGLLRAALGRGGNGWGDWSPGDGAARAARLIEAVAGEARMRRASECASP